MVFRMCGNNFIDREIISFSNGLILEVVRSDDGKTIIDHLAAMAGKIIVIDRNGNTIV
jgi:hypothetical protein